jgi:hypothetical protein
LSKNKEYPKATIIFRFDHNSGILDQFKVVGSEWIEFVYYGMEYKNLLKLISAAKIA